MSLATLIKRADPNDASDVPFEQSMSALAHAYLQDRAPALLDFEVGFQLVSRNDSNSKAIGIMGFKAGSNWLYAPVFFINGDLKGHEILFIKNQDQFVPLDEKWINYLLAKKPATLGEGVNRNTRQLGVHYPDLFRALQSPHKYASVLDDAPVKPLPAIKKAGVTWAKGEKEALAAEAAPLHVKLASAATGGVRSRMKDWAVVGLAAMAKHAVDRSHEPGLLNAIADGGVQGVALLARTFQAYPQLKVAFDTLYPEPAVKSALAKVRARPDGLPRRVKKASAPTFTGSLFDREAREVRSKVEVHRFGGFGKAANVLLSEADRQAVVAQGILIKDAREDDEITRVFAVPTKIETEKKLITPNDSGLYEVLAKDGSFKKCLVITGPIGPNGGASFATVIDLAGGKKSWVNIHPSYVWAKSEYKGWAAWWEDLPDAKTLSAGEGLYVVLGPDGRGTLPFRVTKDIGTDATGGDCYEVDFDDHAVKSRSAYASGVHPYHYPESDPLSYCRYRDGQRVHLGQTIGTRFRTNRGDVYVPEGFKLLKLTKDVEGDDGCEGLGQSEDPPLVLGDAIDVETSILRKMGSLKVRYDGHAYGVGRERPHAPLTSFPEKEAVVHLVTSVGLREATARVLLKEAAEARRAGGDAVEYLLKAADGYSGQYGGQPGGQSEPYLTSGGPYAPDLIDPMQGYDDVMGSSVAAQHPFEESLRVDDLKADPRNRDAYDPVNPDPMTAQVAQDAADKGQKEVFDTAMIGSLLKATRDDQMVDRHIGPLMKGLDHCGRLLFSLYWHGEQFAERYGDAEMPELEDSLRNSFENLGDLVLFLKQRGVEGDPEEAAQSINLSDSANQ